jgi:hypothetical protein
MAVTAEGNAPYAPSSAILDLVKRHRDRGIPAPIDAGVLQRVGISDSLIPRTLQALQMLDLVDENGAPTPVFEAIRLAPEAEYPKKLGEWLKGAYPDVFAYIDPMKDDETRVRDAFRGYQPTGQQARMVTLFQGLCKAAGLMPDVAKPIPIRPRPLLMRPALKAPPKPLAKSPSKSPSSAGSLPPALSGLLDMLPDPADGWTAAERDRFMATFKAVLDYSIPVTTVKKIPEDSG